MFTPDEPLRPAPPHWVDPYNYGAAYHRTQAELTALRNEIRALIAAGRTKQGWVSCNVLEAALEAPR